MAQEPEHAGALAAALPPKLLGHIGLWLSVVACLGCVALGVVGIVTEAGAQSELEQAEKPQEVRAEISTARFRILAGLLFACLAAVGIWLFYDFLKLPDWTVATELPLGLKMLGHLGRIVGSLAAAACVALIVLTIIFPGDVPPYPMKMEGEKWVGIEATEAKFHAPRPGLAAIYVLGFFVSLLVRMLGSGVAEMRRWARLGSFIVSGAAVAALTVALVLNLTAWKFPTATMPLAIFDGLSGFVFLFLLVYFMLPETVKAFEAQRL